MTVELEWNGNQVPATVRGQKLHRHRALVAVDHGVAAVFLAQGPPRGWQRALDAAVAGINASLEKGEVSVEAMMSSAASHVRGLTASLLDVDMIQVHAAVAVVSDSTLTMSTAGSCRGYLDRTGEHRRIKTKKAPDGLESAFTFPEDKEPLKGGDVVIMGASHMFDVSGIATLARLLRQTPPSASRQIVNGMLSLERAKSTGGGAVVLRVS